jgi:menaquinone-specific isochorismate synthase
VQVITLKQQQVANIHAGAALLLSWVEKLKDPGEGLCAQILLKTLDIEKFLQANAGLMRAYFRSRDQDFELGGLGVAHKLHDFGEFLTAHQARLGPDQFYMGGMSFDKRESQAREWRSFERELFFLPLLQISKRQHRIVMMINYLPHAHVPFEAWRDHALSVLRVQNEPYALLELELKRIRYSEEPNFAAYAKNIEHAKNIFKTSSDCRKVVLGRRNTHIFSQSFDPARLFFLLVNKSHKGFSFLLDAGAGSVFFGVSPELLFRRLGRNFETESLAGTRPRSSDKNEDAHLQEELFNSYKDQVEHALVCEHIEQNLKEFGATDLFTSRLEVMSLSFVQHLVKRYHGHISAGLSDDHIIKALHPTPAVCGLNRPWALDFIREHEGFDRGFFAGPIGYFGCDQAEFAVAIRSALYFERKLHIYAACGIVAESQAEQEWEELTNKQKNITSILEIL